MKKKILIITPFLMQGGVEHSLITALSSINFNKNDVTLYLYKNELDLLPQVPRNVHVIQGIDETHYYRRVYTCILLILRKIANLFKSPKYEKKFSYSLSNYIQKLKINYPQKKYFKKSRFDVIISYCLHIGTEMALQINGEKRVLFLHNSHVDYHVDIFDKCCEKYDKIIAVNDSVKHVYANQFPNIKNKITVIENYVNAEKILHMSQSIVSTFSKRKNAFIIITCGRISHEKGFDLAIDAAENLRNKGVNFQWLFVGDGADRAKIEEMIKKKQLEDMVFVTGFQENPYPYMAMSDLYVQTSYEEAQPLVLLEAMIIGKPIVSTKTVGGLHILENGKKGILTDFTGESIAKGILSLINNPTQYHCFENLYSLDDNKRDREIYIEKWDRLLSD